eukprot:g16013.t1
MHVPMATPFIENNADWVFKTEYDRFVIDRKINGNGGGTQLVGHDPLVWLAELDRPNGSCLLGSPAPGWGRGVTCGVVTSALPLARHLAGCLVSVISAALVTDRHDPPGTQ